jgi:hypothetical protein
VNVSPTTSAEDGTTYTIEFRDGDNPLTVYGGTLDVTSGELTVTHGYISSLSTCAWTNTNTANAFVMLNDIPGIVNAGSNPSSPQVDIICSKYQPTPIITLAAELPDKKCTINLNGKKLVIADSSYSGVNDFAQSLSDVQLVYELATPQTYHLTPTQIRTLVGNNNIWADTGDIIEGKYFKSLT